MHYLLTRKIELDTIYNNNFVHVKDQLYEQQEYEKYYAYMDIGTINNYWQSIQL